MSARAALLTVVLIVGGTPPLRDQPEPRSAAFDDVTSSLREENRSLKRLYELASGDSFYLVVDAVRLEMTLAYKGVPLQRYPVLDIELGTTRIAFIRSSIRSRRPETVWSGGRLDPPRPADRFVLSISDTSPAGEPPAAPPTPAMALTVPLSYLLRYEPSLAVEVRRASLDSETGWGVLLTKWREHGRDAVAAVWPPSRKQMRLRIVLTPEDADSLYRSLPPDTKLVILTDRASVTAKSADRVSRVARRLTTVGASTEPSDHR